METSAFLRRVRDHVPFALRNSASHWPAVAHWRDGDIEQICAGHALDPVAVQVALGSTFHGAPQRRSDVQLELRSFVQMFFDEARQPAAKRRRVASSAPATASAASALDAVRAMEQRTGARAKLYLCQHPLKLYKRSGGGSSAQALERGTSGPVLDGMTHAVELPPFLAGCRPELELQQVNLWAGPVLASAAAAEPAASPAGSGCSTTTTTTTTTTTSPAVAADGHLCSTATSLHYDEAHNLLCVVRGSKKVKLWPPSATPLLAPSPIFDARSHHQSLVGTSARDSEMEFTLNVGDIVYIPKGWWHQIESTCGTVAYNIWFQHRGVDDLIRSPAVSSYYLRSLMAAHVEKEVERLISAECNCPEVAIVAQWLAEDASDVFAVRLFIDASVPVPSRAHMRRTMGMGYLDPSAVARALLHAMPRARQATVLPLLARKWPQVWEGVVRKMCSANSSGRSGSSSNASSGGGGGGEMVGRRRRSNATATWLTRLWSGGAEDDDVPNALQCAARECAAFDLKQILDEAVRDLEVWAFKHVVEGTLGVQIEPHS